MNHQLEAVPVKITRVDADICSYKQSDAVSGARSEVARYWFSNRSMNNSMTGMLVGRSLHASQVYVDAQIAAHRLNAGLLDVRA